MATGVSATQRGLTCSICHCTARRMHCAACPSIFVDTTQQPSISTWPAPAPVNANTKSFITPCVAFDGPAQLTSPRPLSRSAPTAPTRPGGRITSPWNRIEAAITCWIEADANSGRRGSPRMQQGGFAVGPRRAPPPAAQTPTCPHTHHHPYATSMSTVQGPLQAVRSTYVPHASHSQTTLPPISANTVACVDGAASDAVIPLQTKHMATGRRSSCPHGNTTK